MVEGRRSMRVSDRSCFSLAGRSCGFLSSAQPSVAVQFRLGFRLASVLTQRLAASPVVRFAQALEEGLTEKYPVADSHLLLASANFLFYG